MKQTINIPFPRAVGPGKKSKAAIAAHEVSPPKGQWKQYWTRHLLNISPDIRLPRGFKQNLVEEVSIPAHVEPLVPPSWIELNKGSITEAVQMLTPAAPPRKPTRKRAKPSIATGK
ncbi:TPA: hypothetical protein QDZ28_004318 [Pseudomonas putida]|nr:hypothetical protein [Pseudomonas putida]